ncbi:MAG TPA: HAD hydrolase family protein [Phycisphaerae bacterium]|jgi:Cof subfamily protein (haloacid dehalogenase superfamily)|nr:HAD hydrolase family protein [Phycisphaerae bacterium]
MNSHWRILGIDLDGTVIGWDRTINPADLDALHRAREAGLHVAICTGRNARESSRVIKALDLAGLGVFVNGAMVSDMATATAVDSQIIDDATVEEAINFFGKRGHGVLVLADDRVTRLPTYFMTDHGPAHRATTDWLQVNEVRSSTVRELPAEARGRVVRVGVVVDVPGAEALHGDLVREFAGRAETHSIYSPHYHVQIVEFFRQGANKWSGIEHMAGVMGVRPDQVIAIGDDVNDLAMLRGARLSFAMGDAKAWIRAQAKRVTGSHKECGVAQVIELLLAGELEPG